MKGCQLYLLYEILSFTLHGRLLSLKIHYCGHNSPQLDFIIQQLTAVYIPPSN